MHLDDILADVEGPMDIKPEKLVQFANMVASTPIQPEELVYLLLECTPYACKSSQAPYMPGRPLLHQDPQQQDLLPEGFGQNLQLVAMACSKLQVPQVAKNKGRHPSDASLVFQVWLKDIHMYILEC